MQGTWSAGTGMYIDVHEDSEHRATPQMTHHSSIAATRKGYRLPYRSHNAS